MTRRLEEAFAEASELPPDEQDAIAGWLLQELESERKWGGAFAQSQEALAERERVRLQTLNPDAL